MATAFRPPRLLLPLLAALGTVGLGALALSASPTPHAPEAGRPRAGEGRLVGRFGHGEAISRLLVLDSAQSAKAAELVARLRSDIAPIRDSRRTLRERLRTELDAPNPNAEAIGRLILDRHSNRGAIRSALERFDQDLSAMLRPEQLARYQEWKDRRAARRTERREHGRRGGPDGPERRPL